jgi:tape measure domain-containing protein
VADNQTTLTINIDTLLRGLEKTLRGLKQVEQQLKRTAGLAGGTQAATGINRASAATQRLQLQQQRAAISAQRLAQQQQALGIRAQQLSNAQTRATQTTQRLQLAQQRLNTAAATTSRQLGQQADAHVKTFRAIERAGQQATQRILGVGNALRSVGQGLASLGATLSVTITAPLAAVGAASVDAAVRMDSLKRGLAAIVGSTDEANRQLARLTQIAKLPGIGFEEAIQGSIRLQAVGFSAKEAETSLRQFANAVALTGGGRDELNRITVQLGQLAAKGKVLSQDLRPIIESAPAVGRALLQAFGTVNADDIQDLGLTTKQFLGILTDELERLPRAAAGAKNSFENFRDEVFRAAAAVGEALLPSLIRLVEVVGPIITRLAEGFARLPGPVRAVVIGVGLLLAALGPVAFVVGQLTLGVGRLLVGLIELNVAGIIPSIAAMRAYAVAALNAAAASNTFTASLAIGGGLGLFVATLAAGAAAIAIYNAFQKDAITISKEHAEKINDEVKALEEQAKFLGGLEAGVERTADEQQRLSDIYDKLNTQAKIRVSGITDEEKRLIALRAELEKVIELRGQERIQQAANVAAQIAASAAIVAANEQGRLSIAGRIAANNALVETLEREGRITDVTRRELERLGQSTSVDVVRAIQNLQEQSARLVDRQEELSDNTKETREEMSDYLATLRVLDPQHHLTARQLLILAKNMGRFKGDVEQMVPVLEAYIKKTDEATKSTDAFNRSLSENERQLNAAGDKAERAAKARQELIQSAAAVARETSVDFEGALKSLRQMIEAVPELRQTVERERQLQGKSLADFLHDQLETAFKGRAKDKSGTTLRNAQEQLAKTLAEVALASAEQQGIIEKQKNDRLLQENENAFRLNLRSLHLYLSQRAALLKDNLQLEINDQKALVDAAIAEQQRFLARAGQAGIPATEKIKAQAGAKTAEEKAIKAQTKILELTDKQRQADAEASQELAEHSRRQQADLRQLEVEYGQLRERIEDALNAATDERFRDSLQQLALDQETLNKRIRAATANRKADELEELRIARDRNQTQIEAIQGIIRQERALNRLTAVQDVVNKAQQRQSNLEDQITNDVELRGLTEEQAVKRRLAGERELREELIRQRDSVEAVALALFDAGRTVPTALTEFIAQTDIAIDRLGKLSFAEQFRLAEKEFTRLNDLRLQKIADVERAVRNRDIAEAEGLLLIRRINGQYVGDLERQLALLKSIAEASNDQALQQQAQSAAETTKDAADSLASLNRQIRATSIDALQDSLTNFLIDLTDRTKTAKEKLLGFVNSLAASVNRVIAENLSRKFVESLFGTGGIDGGGIIAGIKRLFGFGDKGKGSIGGAGSIVGGAVEGAGLQTAAASAAVTLQTGATTAATTTVGSGVTFATTVASAASAFAAIVTTAATAVATALAASSAVSGAGGGLGTALGAAATGDILPAQPGGRIVRVAEGGHAEAVLTTDPRHVTRQARLLSRFLRMTKGLQGRFPVPEMASGGLVTPLQAEANVLGSISRTPLSTGDVGNLPLAAAGGGSMRLRQVLVDQRNYRDWLTSSEGEQVIVDLLYRNQPVIRKLGGNK